MFRASLIRTTARFAQRTALTVALAAVAGRDAAANDIPLAGTYVVNPGTEVRAVAIGADGSSVLGGNFSMVGPRLGAGIVMGLAGGAEPDPTTFPLVAGGPIYAAASDGAGGWFIGGQFTSVGGMDRPRLAHILANGTLDTAWNPAPALANGSGTVYALAVTATDVYFGGDFDTVGAGVGRKCLARAPIGGSGAVDPSWNPNLGFNANGSCAVRAIQVSGTDVFFGGDFMGPTVHHVGKASTTGNGTPDTSWNPDLSNQYDTVSAIAVAGTDLYFGGSFSSVNAGNATRNGLAKTSTTGNGTVDPTWNPNVGSAVNAIVVSGTQVIFGGTFSVVNGGTSRAGLARTATTGIGTVDATWNPSALPFPVGSSTPPVMVLSLALSPTGDVYVGGLFATISGAAQRNNAARILATSNDGAFDSTWSPNANGQVRALALQGTSVYVGGAITSAGSKNVQRKNLAKLVPDGSVDPSWNPAPNGRVNAVAIAGTSVFFGGNFSSVNGSTARSSIAKASLDGNGTVDSSWAPTIANGSSAGEVYAIATSSADVFFGGSFTTVGGLSRSYLAKAARDGSGTPDSAWNPGADQTVYALAVAGNAVYAAGSFTQVGSQNHGGLARLASTGNGAPDSAWSPSVSPPYSAVYAIVVSGSDLFAAGAFTSVGGTSRNRLAKIPTTGGGGVDGNWNPNADGSVNGLAIASGALIAVGQFSHIGGLTRNGVANIATTGAGVVANWNPDLGAPSGGATYPYGYAVAAAGTQVFVGGTFTRSKGLPSSGIAQFSVLPGTFSISPASVDFGYRGIGITTGQTFTVQNTGGDTDILVPPGALTLTGPQASAFALSDVNCVGAVLHPLPQGGNACSFRAFFSPFGAPGARTATIVIADTATSAPHNVGLAGVAVPIVAVTTEPVGGNCPAGGQRVDMALGDGTIGTTYVCNGLAGSPGSAGADAVVSVTTELAGEHCAAGGQRIETRVGAGPAVTSYICNGEDGTSVLAVAEAAGANCPYGGIKVSGEGDAQFVCDGAPGAQGAAGSDGVSVTVTAEPAGVHCAAGGLRLLSASGTSYVCNGRSANVVATAEPVGEHCAAGGFRVDSSVGSESATTSFVCNGVAGASATVIVTSEAPGVNCAAGGKRVDTRVGSGELVTSYVCNGRDGVGLIAVAEAPGANCAHGGIKVTSTATDPTQPGAETGTTSFVCNGPPGPSGHDTLLVVDDRIGSACASEGHGGQRINAGLDDGAGDGTADDGTLQLGEVDVTSVICHGATGPSGERGYSTIAATDTDVGTYCDAFGNGGQHLVTGVDDGEPSGTANDGILEADEIDAEMYICNGSDGRDGSDGQDAFATLFMVDGVVGTMCGAGATGHRIRSGADDGAAEGIARDHVLQDGEVEATFYVCDGANGAAGHNALVQVDANVGDQCVAAGGAGQRILTGVDDGSGDGVPDDGRLDHGEIQQTAYLCAGPAGRSGYEALVASDANVGTACLAGGTRIRSGVDDGDPSGVAGNGALEDAEVDGTVFVCNGASGHSSLVRVEQAPVDLCPGPGGVALFGGLDDGAPAGIADNGILEEGEVDSIQPVCTAPGFSASGGGCGAGGFGASGVVLWLAALALAARRAWR